MLSLHVFDFVLERHRDQCFVESGYPRMAKCFLGSVPHWNIELGKSVEQVSSKRWEVFRKPELTQSEKGFFVLFSREVVWVEKRMLATCEQHIHDDANSEHVNAWWVALLLDQLWAHKYESTHLILVIVYVLMFVLGTEPKVSDFETWKIIWVCNQDIVRL